MRRAACPRARRLVVALDAGARLVDATAVSRWPAACVPTVRDAEPATSRRSGRHGLRRGSARAGRATRGTNGRGGGPEGLVDVAAVLGGPGQVPGHRHRRPGRRGHGARAPSSLGWSVRQVPLSDGGEGLLDVLGELGAATGDRRGGGPARPVPSGRSGSLGEPGRHRDGTGLRPVAGRRGRRQRSGAGHDPWDRPAHRGRGPGSRHPRPRRRTVPTVPRRRWSWGLGGSATTDGGLGALDVIEEAGGLGGVALIGACDVDVGFVEAAGRFGPQKGAGRAQVAAARGQARARGPRYRRRVRGRCAARSRGPGRPVASGGRSSPSADVSDPDTRSSPSCSDFTVRCLGARWW